MYCDFMGRAGDEIFNQLAKWQTCPHVFGNACGTACIRGFKIWSPAFAGLVCDL